MAGNTSAQIGKKVVENSDLRPGGLTEPRLARVCLFAQYNSEDRLQPAVLRYFEELTRAGYRVHAALSGKTRVAASDRSRLDALGVEAHLRPNMGLDFGAWSELIRKGAAADADEVLLANDSVLGPFRPLGPIAARMAGYDAWGMVLSREARPHLQSWFVSMTRAAFLRPAVQRVFAFDFAPMSKQEIIIHGELGLGAAFEAEGMDVGACHRSRFRLRPSTIIPANPMHFRWREMLEEGVPFLKLDLIRDNPSKIMDATRWREVLRKMGIEEAWFDGLGELPGRPPSLGWAQVLRQIIRRENRARLLMASRRRP